VILWQEKAQVRISTKGIRADDIKHENLLSDEQIADIDIERVYEWVRIGAWKQKDFKKWLRVIRVIE
jgi:flagellar basal body L-ring protein FlgH